MTNNWHQEQVDWIVKVTDEIRLKSPEQQVVVLTHHAPSSYRCLWPATRGDVIAKMQYDELEHLMKPPMVCASHKLRRHLLMLSPTLPFLSFSFLFIIPLLSSCTISSPQSVWAFGHTHCNSDYIRGDGVRVLSNQCGYIRVEKKPSAGYDPGKVVSITETEEMIAQYMVNSMYRCNLH